MNEFLRLPPIRFLLLVIMPVIGAQAQSAGPYKNLVTAANTLVADTVSGQNLSIYVVSPVAQHGDVDIDLLQSGGSGNPYIFAIKYTPDPGYIGVDTFTVELNYQGSYPFLVYRGYKVSVYPSIVSAQSDFAVTAAGTPVTINVLANDNSVNGPLTLAALPLVNNGTAVITGGNSIRFTPAPGFSGIGHVNYVVCDATSTCKTGQYTIGVNNGNPVNDTLNMATAKNTSVLMPLTHTGYSVFQAPANGNVLMLNGHSFRYTPLLNFTGIDQFILATNQYGQTVYKTVVVHVLNTPAQNMMAMDDLVFTPKGTPITFNVRDNDIGNLLVKSWVVPNNFPGSISGTTGNGNVTFTPNPNFTGVATFQYKIGNMFVPDLEIATVRVVVGNMNPSAGLFEMTTPRSTPFVIEYDIPFNGFSFHITDQPDHGTCAFYPGYNTLTLNGQTVSGNNLLVYTPDGNYVGSDEFEMDYCVTANGQCQSVKITMDVVNVVSAQPPYCITGCSWPGDINNDGVVNNKDILPLGYFMGSGGPPRNNASLEWYGQHAPNWNNPFAGSFPDLKYADTDGNGKINVEDTLAVGFFYGQTHNLTPYLQPTSKGLPFFLNLLTPNPGVGDLVEVEVSLGSASQPVTNLYGFTFDVQLSPQIVDSALRMQYYNGTWLNRNSPDLWMYKTPKQGRLESAFTRTNGVAGNGFGVIGKFDFIIIDIVDDSKLNSSPYFNIRIDNPTAMWADGGITISEHLSLNIPLRIQQKHGVSSGDLFVYPSPAQDLLQIHLNGDEFIETLSIFDLTGRQVYDSGPVQWERAELSIGHLPEGVYVASARTASGQVTKKFQILR
ncbi:MAG: Ig-like domain-containing protein [Thermoanaerobaculia bacterium]|nr:Ig-like domain-containing protein [Thermoanaerobaculia bacterium]